MRVVKREYHKATATSSAWLLFLVVVLVVLAGAIRTRPVRSQELTPTPEPEPIAITAEDMTLEIERFEIWDSAGDRNPDEDVFIILLAVLHNGKDNQECTRARSVRLYLDGEEYRPQNGVMDDVKEILEPTRDFMGAYRGHCIEAGESATTFAAFDTPEDFSEVELAFKGTRVTLAFETSDTGVISGTPVPVVVTGPDEAALARSIVASSLREVETVTIQNEGAVSTILARYKMPVLGDVDVAGWEAIKTICDLLDAGFVSHIFRFEATIEVVDNFGNTSTVDGLVAVVRPETAERLNCENWILIDLDNVADSYYVHPALR